MKKHCLYVSIYVYFYLSRSFIGYKYFLSVDTSTCVSEVSKNIGVRHVKQVKDWCFIH